MFSNALRKIIQKFETTGNTSRHRMKKKKIPFFAVENVYTEDIEGSSHSLHGSVSVSDVSQLLDRSHFSEQ